MEEEERERERQAGEWERDRVHASGCGTSSCWQHDNELMSGVWRSAAP